MTSPPDSSPIRRVRVSSGRPSRASSAVARSSTSQSSPIASKSAGSVDPASTARIARRVRSMPRNSVTGCSVAQGEVLGEVADPAGDRDVAGGRCELAGDQAQQGGLAGPVGADQAGAARPDEQVEAAKDEGAVGPGEADATCT